MDAVELVESVIPSGQRLARALVTRVDGHAATVLVPTDGGDPEIYYCDVLSNGNVDLTLSPGDRVLVWCDESPAHRGVVLGRIGAPARGSSANASAQTKPSVPDTLVLEAKKSLTIRVGDGSITIRKDGKILIKGRDLVSHAQRTNRIKGGSVAIN
jgi:hypothetical protein